MSLLGPPKSLYTNFYEQEKFKLCWNLCMTIAVLFSVLTIYHGITGNKAVIPAAAGTLIAVTVLLYLKARGTYRTPAILAFFAATIVIQADIFVIMNQSKGIDICWIITAGLFVYYMIGTVYGSVFLFVNVTGLLIAVFLGSRGYFVPKEPVPLSVEIPNVIFNISVAFFVTGYMISKIIRSSKIAEKSYHAANERLKEQNAVVLAQNDEKTVLLKEIHHRVKNNLQVITSLLRLQSGEIKDADSITHFRETINRVMAMALIHDRLYQSEDFSKIDLQQYLKLLANDLIGSYSVEIPVDVSVDSEVEQINPKSVVSVALLFNELISNSLKHGFEAAESGEIRIQVKQTKDDDGKDLVEMWYSDNGQWKEPSERSSFGLDLIETLTGQLDGVYELDTTQGVSYHFTFLLEEYVEVNS